MSEPSEPPRKWIQVGARERCPRCDSPSPHLHPAVQHEGEVQVCSHVYHARLQVTEAAQTVHDTFVKDEAQGYHSSDRQYAIAILGAALSAVRSQRPRE